MIQLNLMQQLSLTFTFAFAFACGPISDQEEQDQRANEGTNQMVKASSTLELSEDKALISEDVSAQANAAIQAISGLESTSNGGASFALKQEAGSDLSKDEERVCEASDDGKATVTITRLYTRDKSFDGPNFSKTVTGQKSASHNRVWSHPDGQVPCDSEGVSVDIAPEDLAGHTMTANFQRETELNITTTRNEDTQERSRSTSAEGTRTVDFTESDLVDGSLVVKKSVAFTSKIDSERTNKEGELRSSSYSLDTVEGAPLVIEEVKEGMGRGWQSKKIVSGKTLGANADGGRVEITYDNALFEKSGECEPVSGTIKGEIFDADGLSLKTFTADLSAQKKVITFADGSTKELDLTGCGLAKPAKSTARRIVKGKHRKFAKGLGQGADRFRSGK